MNTLNNVMIIYKSFYMYIIIYLIIIIMNTLKLIIKLFKEKIKTKEEKGFKEKIKKENSEKKW